MMHKRKLLNGYKFSFSKSNEDSDDDIHHQKQTPKFISIQISKGLNKRSKRQNQDKKISQKNDVTDELEHACYKIHKMSTDRRNHRKKNMNSIINVASMFNNYQQNKLINCRKDNREKIEKSSDNKSSKINDNKIFNSLKKSKNRLQLIESPRVKGLQGKKQESLIDLWNLKSSPKSVNSCIENDTSPKNKLFNIYCEENEDKIMNKIINHKISSHKMIQPLHKLKIQPKNQYKRILEMKKNKLGILNRSKKIIVHENNNNKIGNICSKLKIVSIHTQPTLI